MPTPSPFKPEIRPASAGGRALPALAPARPLTAWIDQAVLAVVILAVVLSVAWCLAWWWPHQWRQALGVSAVLALALALAWARWLPLPSRAARWGVGAALVLAACVPPWPAYQHWLSAQAGYPQQYHAYEAQLEAVAQRALDLHQQEAPGWPPVAWQLPHTLRRLEQATKQHALAMAQDEWLWRQAMQAMQIDRLLGAQRLQQEDGLAQVRAALAQAISQAKAHQAHQQALHAALAQSLSQWAEKDGADSPLRDTLAADLDRMAAHQAMRWQGELAVLGQLEAMAQWLQSEQGRWQIRNDTLVFLHASTLQAYRDRQDRLVQAQEAQRERLQARRPSLWMAEAPVTGTVSEG